MADGKASKDECKTILDFTFRKWGDTVNRNMFLEEEIPHVGKLLIKNNIAAVMFKDAVLEATKFSTVKKYEGIFNKNNLMNNKIYEPNKAMYGLLNSSIELDKPQFI